MKNNMEDTIKTTFQSDLTKTLNKGPLNKELPNFQQKAINETTKPIPKADPNDNRKQIS